MLKAKQKAALIVVLTLGLAAVPIGLNTRTNLFEGCSLWDRRALCCWVRMPMRF